MPKKSWSVGAKKAHAAMVARYGKTTGEKVFYAKANKVKGGGGSLNAKVSQAFKKGGTQKPKGRR